MKSWWSDLSSLWQFRDFAKLTATDADQRQEEVAASSLLETVQRPAAAQVFAQLYDNLVVKWQEHTVRLVTVCAATPGAGASTVALGLALAACRDPHEKLLLVDGNFHQPTLSQLWNLEGRPGLAEYLLGLADLGVVQPTPVANLWMLANGGESRSHAKLMDPHLFDRNLSGLVDGFSLVIIDSPALSQHPEAPIYAHFSDRILLVVAAGRSRAPVVQHSISRFPVGLRERLEVVLNRRTYPIPRFIYDKLWSY